MAKSIFTLPYLNKTIEEGLIPDPLISLPIKSINGWQDIWFLLDSGADTTMLSTVLAETLGIPYNKAKPTKLFGIGDKSVNAYPGTIILKIGNQELNVRAYFSGEDESDFLLGRLDIFDRFDISFLSSKQKIVFTKI